MTESCREGSVYSITNLGLSLDSCNVTREKVNNVLRADTDTGDGGMELGEKWTSAKRAMLILHKTPTVKFLPLVNVNDVGAAQKATFRFKCIDRSGIIMKTSIHISSHFTIRCWHDGPRLRTDWH